MEEYDENECCVIKSEASRVRTVYQAKNQTEVTVDPQFRREELESWLARRGLVPRWEEGVYERLSNEGFRVSDSSPELQSCRIWQLKPGTPIQMRFIGLDAMAQKFGGPTPEQYHVVYDGRIQDNDLEKLWNKFSRTPLGPDGQPLAISDVVELYNASGSTLDGIKSKTVGDGQHGTARWATKQEIRQTYAHIPFEPELWRKGEHLPEKQGLILGCEGPKNHVTALVDTDDIHAMVTAASGAGKTAFFLYPNIEYALASGMSFLCTDTKGDLYRNYAGIAKDFYGYQIAVLDLRNPTRSDGNNLLHLINKYMDIYKANPNDLAAKAKAEKYSKILAKTLINTSGGDSAQYGQNAFFYDSAEGLLTAMFLLVAEYLPTEDENGNPVEKRHIVSVFKLVQELLAPSKVKGKNQFQILLEKLPPNHKARWFAGSALNTAEQAMASVISTVLSRLNAFLDSEMEQILCFDTAIDAEKFCNEKSAIFIVLPEEDQTKYFMVSLILQNLYREILTVADENGGRLKNRVVFFADELGTCPPIQSLELMFSASRSRGLMLVPIVQSITGQLKKNYGAEGAEVIVDNCQVNLYGGFAPASQTAVELSKALGSRTVMSGSISRGKNDPSQSLQMIERPLMTPDELKSMPKGSFIVAKTGVHPMKVKLRLFLDWGIRFGEPYEVPEKAQRAVAYADKQELEESIIRRHYGTVAEEERPQDVPAAVGGMNHGMQAEKNSRKTILRP